MAERENEIENLKRMMSKMHVNVLDYSHTMNTQMTHCEKRMQINENNAQRINESLEVRRFHDFEDDTHVTKACWTAYEQSVVQAQLCEQKIVPKVEQTIQLLYDRFDRVDARLTETRTQLRASVQSQRVLD